MESTKLPLQRLSAFFGYLRGARIPPESAEAGPLDTAVKAECTTCGLILSPQDIAALASSEGERNEKVKRIEQGYCGRAGCNSYFYDLTFPDRAGVDWNGLVSGFDPMPASDTLEVPRASASVQDLRRRWIVVGALLLVVGVWLGRNYWISGKLPGFAPQYRFKPVAQPQAARPGPPGRTNGSNAPVQYPFHPVR